jgi:hypothetical protein
MISTIAPITNGIFDRRRFANSDSVCGGVTTGSVVALPQR